MGPLGFGDSREAIYSHLSARRRRNRGLSVATGEVPIGCSLTHRSDPAGEDNLLAVARSASTLALATFLSIAAVTTLSATASAQSTSPTVLNARPGSQCAALFRPAPLAITFHSSVGLVSADGVPYQSPLPIGLKNSDPATSLVIANTVSVFSMKQVEDILKKTDDELPKEMRALYTKMKERGDKRYLVQARSLDILKELYESMPNFKPALDQIKRSMAISIAAGEPIRFQPIILLGDPGVGKTYFANKLAEALGTDYEFISMGTLTAGWILSGASSQWKDARMGRVAKALIEKDNANPVIVLDEVDKASSNAQYDPLAPLYNLWEKGTSRKFNDEFVDGVDLDASHINWIATANYLDQIPAPIRSRAIVVTIKAPDRKQLEIIAGNVLKGELSEHPNLRFSNEISSDVFELLAKHSPREIRKLLSGAIGNAIIQGRTVIRPEDIDLSIIETERVSRPIGFGT